LESASTRFLGRRSRLSRSQYSLCAVVVAGLSLAGIASGQSKPYAGEPFHDSVYHDGAQKIPGRVQCAYYDFGGEGIAYHDADAKNNGSGSLNPPDGSHLNTFRMDEGVDTSYTKFHDQIDDSSYDLVQPPQNQLYVGWTEPGEWFNMTVKVQRPGLYSIDLLYTSNGGGEISFDLNGKKLSGALAVSSTYNTADPIAWRQWHHWNVARDFVEVKLPRGINVLTLHVVSNGNMNLAYLEFKPSK
jgi:hypothetical protein